MRRSLQYFIIGLCLAACKKEIATSPTLPAATYYNVKYGQDPHKEIDVYLPAGRDTMNTKLLLLVHGGIWSFGDKSDLRSYVSLSRQHLPGYAIANINYRLVTETENKFPAQEEDISSAVNFLLQHTGIYTISNKFVLIGESSGAHLALLQAYKHSDKFRPSAVIDFFGPTDLTEMYMSTSDPLIRESLDFILMGTPQSNPTNYYNSSPINFVSSTVCPTMILHGGRDLLVDPNQSVLLRKRLDSLHVANEYVYYPNEDHGWSGETLNNSFERIQNFLTTYVK